MVNFRSNWTLYTGEVRNLEETPQQKPYQGRVKGLFIFHVYHSFRLFAPLERKVASGSSLLQEELNDREAKYFCVNRQMLLYYFLNASVHPTRLVIVDFKIKN